VAKRNDLTQKLTGGAPGWRDMIPRSDDSTRDAGEKDSSTRAKKNGKPSDKKIRKTYYIRESTISRIEQISNKQKVGISDLVEFGLTRFLEMLESGQIKMKTEVKEVRQIIY
jgi:hypothetical protein